VNPPVWPVQRDTTSCPSRPARRAKLSLAGQLRADGPASARHPHQFRQENIPNASLQERHGPLRFASQQHCPLSLAAARPKPIKPQFSQCTLRYGHLRWTAQRQPPRCADPAKEPAQVSPSRPVTRATESSALTAPSGRFNPSPPLTVWTTAPSPEDLGRTSRFCLVTSGTGVTCRC
jgi:hypothetical protein